MSQVDTGGGLVGGGLVYEGEAIGRPNASPLRGLLVYLYKTFGGVERCRN